MPKEMPSDTSFPRKLVLSLAGSTTGCEPFRTEKKKIDVDGSFEVY
jgi:hypothetical protein